MSRSSTKTGQILDFYNKKNHYQHILKPRETMKPSPDIPTLTTLHFNNRYYNQSQRNRKQDNIRLLGKLITIKEQKTKLGQLFLKSKRKKNEARKHIKSMASNRSKGIDWQIDKANKALVYKISQAQPRIGNKSEWKKHYKDFKRIEKNLKRFSVDYEEKRPQQFMKTLDNFHQQKPNTTLFSRYKEGVSLMPSIKTIEDKKSLNRKSETKNTKVRSNQKFKQYYRSQHYQFESLKVSDTEKHKKQSQQVQFPQYQHHKKVQI